jgi:hypothetical protein
MNLLDRFLHQLKMVTVSSPCDFDDMLFRILNDSEGMLVIESVLSDPSAPELSDYEIELLVAGFNTGIVALCNTLLNEEKDATPLFDQRIIDLANRYRERDGLPPLNTNGTIG